MNGSQFEPFSPNLQPPPAKQPTAKWMQPKIRVHKSVHATPKSHGKLSKRPPLRDISLFNVQNQNQTSAQAMPTSDLTSRLFKSTRVRVIAPRDDPPQAVLGILKTTPVTNPTISKVPKFRIAGIEPQQGTSVCRRLFPNVTPTKRRRNATPSFRFSCGRERTQPESSARPRSHLIDALDTAIEEAARNVLTFRNGLSGSHSDVTFQRALKGGLLLAISRRRDNILTLQPLGSNATTEPIVVELIVTDEMLSNHGKPGNPVGSTGQVIYIPRPWYVQEVREKDNTGSRIVLAAHKVDVFASEEIGPLGILPTHEGYQALQDQVSSDFPRVPRVLESEMSFYFAALSPHMRTTNISVFVDFFAAGSSLAVVRDDSDQPAVLFTTDADMEVSRRKQIFRDVRILPHKVPGCLVWDVIARHNEDALTTRLAVIQSKNYLLTLKQDN